MTENVDESLQKLGIRRITHPTKDEIRDAYHRVDTTELNDVWGSYLTGQQSWHPWETYSPPNLKVLRYSDVRVYHRNSVPCQCGHDLTVERLSVDYSIFEAGNYAGYDSTEHCYAFRGQRRLLDDFLDRAEVLFEKEEVKSALVGPVGISIPFSGFPSGWKFEEFAMHAETIMCLLFLASNDKDPLDFEGLAIEAETEPDSDADSDFLRQESNFGNGPQPAMAVESGQGLDNVSDILFEPDRYPRRQRK
ncbi:hypothetical protein MHUMG1_09102 [Metarhizium humberi]|uniref:Uncharacterized protein n=2 Tax=Metarhizium TaxID=5529 RepID=A0A0D9NRL2_METAN|nr:hypothetical protein MHUMG1_09102 [Metarhizium humberi]KJK76433.1 hypothetical protein H634G_08324 [Metarhizium anisopliae BRIP 53293]KJK88340.1 hypothetical protein H633G_07784 [Metarhizium anisopliae BRIP 53284]